MFVINAQMRDDNMKCPICKSEDIKIIASLIVGMPIKYLYHLKKVDIRKKDISLMGVNWNKSNLCCNNCHHIWREEL
jgi:hypothetical protein